MKDISRATSGELAEELNIRQTEEFNRAAIIELLPQWCECLTQNITISRRAKNLSEYPRFTQRGKNAIVVGAAPNLTDEDILKLKGLRDTDIIITNKNYKRFLDLGVFFHWVCVLDSHPISAMQFLDANKNRGPFPNFLVSTTVFPQTVGIIEEITKGATLYMFNPIIDTGGHVRISQTWKWMNDKDEMDHGGSVGTLAVQLASSLRYKRVGLLGFGLCEKGDPTWTIEQAKERDHIYYPDTNEYVSIPPHYKGYLAYIFMLEQESNWACFVNLSDSPVLRHSPLLRQGTIETFEEI